MKLTLLQLTQNILSAMNSDEVNSISDTTESMQVATAIQTTYMNMIGRYELPEHIQLIQLNPSNDPASPVLMTRPDDITRIEWIKYFDTNPADGNTFTDQYGSYSHDLNTDLQNNANGWSTSSTTSATVAVGTQTFTVPAALGINANDPAYAVSGLNVMTGTVTSYSGTTLVLNITAITGSGTYFLWNISEYNSVASGPGYKYVRIMPVEDFITMTNSFNSVENDVQSFQLAVINDASQLTSQFTFNYMNDRQPENCCIIQNYYIIFDSYDNTQDTTLQASKSMCMGWVSPTFKMEDSFTPILDDQQFPLLLNDAKSLAFYELKQQPHRKAEDEVSKQVISLQKWKALADHPSYFEQLPNFARGGSGFQGMYRGRGIGENW